MADKPTEFKDDRKAVFVAADEEDLKDPGTELTLEDLKGSRSSRGNPEWRPKGRKPGEDTTGGATPAPPSRRATGAGPT